MDGMFCAVGGVREQTLSLFTCTELYMSPRCGVAP